jgi:hypothetical protein
MSLAVHLQKRVYQRPDKKPCVFPPSP